LKRFFLLLPLMLPASLALADAGAKLDAEGQRLYQKLVHAADTNDCETVIITGFQFKQGYSAYLDTHPEANDKAEASISTCLDEMSTQSIPVESPSGLGMSEPNGQ
jgi:hypothetical protein